MTDPIPDIPISAATPQGSPRWGQTTKLVVGLTIMAALAALVIQFRDIVGPLILTFILAFVFHPLAAHLVNKVHLSWRTSVNVIYLVLIVILLGSFTATSYALVGQIQSLVITVESFVTDLPAQVAQLSMQSFAIGPFVLDLSQFDLTKLTEQILGVVQPMLGQVGNLVSLLASGAASVFGWGSFILLVSYFLLSETGDVSGRMVPIDLPGYNEDLRRLGRDLGNTWNAFLRGQLLICLLVVIMYAIVLTILGVRFSLAIAFMAGLARFIPWLGPFITWLVTFLVAVLQKNYFDLDPLKFAVLVLAVCLILDQIFDNLVSPRILGQSLGVHPAGVLVAAIIVTNLLGIVGLVLAAPLLATINLVGRYILRKMFDLEPWPEKDIPSEKEIELPWARLQRRVLAWLRLFRRRS